jgi:uncharacterized FlaG/YvyC family protein
MEMATLTTVDIAGAGRPREPGPGEAAGDAQARPEAAGAWRSTNRDIDREVELIERLRGDVNTSARSKLLIDRDEEAGRFIYRVLDPETGETMRQWPPEQYLELVA